MTTAQRDTLLGHLRQLAAGPQGTDGQLLDDFAARHSEAAFAALVARHGPMVLRVCRRVLNHEQDAEDAFQATFLVLATHPTAIRRREVLAGWLHGVAYRTAMKAKRTAARRRNHEARLHPPTPRPAPGPLWDDVQTALDEEIQALPGPARAAFVLYAVEGRTVPEAAAELGVKPGTLSSRLTRARQHLRRRLLRRGIKLAALLAALALAEAPGKGAVPASLVRSTVRFGLLVAAGGPAAAIPTHVAALAAGVTRAMFLTKTKIATAALIAAGLLVAAGGALAYQTLAPGENPAPAAAAEPPASPPAKPPEETTVPATFRGRVLDPAGKPVVGARLHLIGTMVNWPTGVHAEAKSTAGGAFRLPVALPDARRLADDASWSTISVVATADGYGAAFDGASEPSAGLTLRLVKDDVPVRGRILDLEGKPLAGVTVRVEELSAPNNGSLTPWLAALEANPRDAYPIAARFLDQVRVAEVPGIFPAVGTDAGGRFEIGGVGRERVVQLALEGPTIAREHISVYTRPGKTFHARGFAYNPNGVRLTYYGASFDHLAAPTRPIVGVVRDKNTGKPLAGVTVQSDQFAGSNLSGDDSVRSVTDRDGRFRLVGMPKGAGNALVAAPAPGQPYLRARREVANSPGLDPVAVDFALQRGVLVRGRVLDKATGRPVYAQVHYAVFRDNPRPARVPDFTIDHYLETGADGSYQLVAFPGRGLLCARGWGDHYLMGVGADKIKGTFQQGLLDTLPFLQETNTEHTYVEINPPDGAASVTCDLVLDPGTMPHGTLVGPDGKALDGVRAFGLTAYNRSREWNRTSLKGGAFTVWGLGPADEREVVFVHESKHLAGVVQVRGDVKEPLRVQMEPWATVTGRLVGPDGKPRPGLLLKTEDRFLQGTPLQADREGRFRVTGLAPGVKYSLSVVQNGQPTAAVFAGLTLKPAEVRDLGDVVVNVKK